MSVLAAISCLLLRTVQQFSIDGDGEALAHEAELGKLGGVREAAVSPSRILRSERCQAHQDGPGLDGISFPSPCHADFRDPRVSRGGRCADPAHNPSFRIQIAGSAGVSQPV